MNPNGEDGEANEISGTYSYKLGTEPSLTQAPSASWNKKAASPPSEPCLHCIYAAILSSCEICGYEISTPRDAF